MEKRLPAVNYSCLPNLRELDLRRVDWTNDTLHSVATTLQHFLDSTASSLHSLDLTFVITSDPPEDSPEALPAQLDRLEHVLIDLGLRGGLRRVSYKFVQDGPLALRSGPSEIFADLSKHGVEVTRGL